MERAMFHATRTASRWRSGTDDVSIQVPLTSRIEQADRQCLTVCESLPDLNYSMKMN